MPWMSRHVVDRLDQEAQQVVVRVGREDLLASDLRSESAASAPLDCNDDARSRPLRASTQGVDPVTLTCRLISQLGRMLQADRAEPFYGSGGFLQHVSLARIPSARRSPGRVA